MADDLFKPFSSCFIPKKKKKKKTWGISLVLGAWNQKQREKKVSFRPESGFATEDILLLHTPLSKYSIFLPSQYYFIK
jgi:hypothetical protein